MRSVSRPLAVVVAAMALAVLGGCAVRVASTTTTETDVTDAVTQDASGGTFESAVTRVVDGDSIEFRFDGDVLEGRLQGANAPELYNDADQLTCNGGYAKDALAQLLGSGDVNIEIEETDRYGRSLIDITVASPGESKVDVVETLVSQGWLLASGDDDDLRATMAKAAKEKLGMFGSRCGFAVNTQLVISDVQADAPGNDKNNLNEEWVELNNESDDAIDLAGWVLRDETTGHRFDLTGNVLEARKKLKVRSGSGSNSAKDRYLGERFPVWSNDRETVLLVDPDGVIAQVVFL